MKEHKHNCVYNDNPANNAGSCGCPELKLEASKLSSLDNRTGNVYFLDVKYQRHRPVSCWMCVHLNHRSYKVTSGQKNVSGGISWLRIWAKHRCNLEQEHLSPKNCDFEENIVFQEELDRRYPDLAQARKELIASTDRLEKLVGNLFD